MRVHPFSSGGGFDEGWGIPEFCLGFPGAFHRTVLLYYGRQVSEVCYVTATYGVAKERNCIFLATVLDLVHYKEESGPIVVYCLLGLLFNVGKTVYVWVGGLFLVRTLTRSETQGRRSFRSWKFGLRDIAQ